MLVRLTNIESDGMKKIVFCLLTLISATSFCTTLLPIQLINPAGSSSGQSIVSTGTSTIPAWSAISLTSGVSGILPVANGGTGIAFFTAAGPTVARTYTFPDVAATILYSGGALGTPSSGVATNLTGTASGMTSGSVTTNANLTGPVTSVGNATTIGSGQVTLANLATESTNTVVGNATGGTASPTALAVGSCSTSGSALIWTTNTGFGCNTSIAANTVATNANLTGGVTSIGNAATVVTNANLTGPITSSGNVTSIGAKSGTGSTFLMATAPSLTASPAQFDSSTNVATTASVVQQSGNHSGYMITAISSTLPNTAFGSVVLVSASGTTQSLPSAGGAVGQTVIISSVFTSGSTTVNVSAGNTTIYGPTGVGSTTFIVNAGEIVTFTIDPSNVYVVTNYLSLNGTYQSILKHSAQEVDTSYMYATPVTTGTVTMATGVETALINPAGTLAALTVTLPACTSGYDGSLARFSSTQIITSLTVNATSGTVADGATTLAVGSGNGYLCRGSSTTWYRLY